MWAYLLSTLVNGFKAGELIWSNVALSRALLGQWSRVGSLGRVYVIVVDTFEEKRRVVTIDNVDFTIYCLL